MSLRTCACGCGGYPNIAKRTYGHLPIKAGEQYRYINGHAQGKSVHEYMEDDRGFATPCWIWQRQIGPDGYGRARRPVPPRQFTTAHRVIWERVVGAIPDKLVLDHLCGVKACVNPQHLELVTHAENLLRSRLTESLGVSATTVVAALAKHPDRKAIVRLLAGYC